MENRGRRALVVDDHETTRLLVEAVLKKEGYLTDSAKDGAEAIQILESAPGFELIVLDLMMPRVDGYGVIEYLQSGGFPSPLRKILLVTASPNLVDEARLPQGICEVLLKPFTGEVLLERVV